MRHLSKVALLSAALFNSSQAMAAVCSQATAGTVGEVDQTYVKMQVHNYSSTTGQFDVWLSPRVSGNTSGCVSNQNGLTYQGRTLPIVDNPLCNTAAWGTVSMQQKDGSVQSDKTIWYVGRIQMTLDELLNGVHTQYKAAYDFNLIVNQDKTLNKFCVDKVQGNSIDGTSAYWPVLWIWVPA